MGISLRVTNPAQSTTMGLQHIFLMERDSFPPLPSMHPQTHTPIQISSLYLYAAHRQAAVVSKSHSYMPLATSGDGCGDGTRTHDLQLMRLTSYQAALSRGGNSSTHSLSAPASCCGAGSGRSSSSTSAMGAASPTRKPILRMRV